MLFTVFLIVIARINYSLGRDKALSQDRHLDDEPIQDACPIIEEIERIAITRRFRLTDMLSKPLNAECLSIDKTGIIIAHHPDQGPLLPLAKLRCDPTPETRLGFLRNSDLNLPVRRRLRAVKTALPDVLVE